MRTEIFRRLAGVVCAAALVWLAVPVVPAQADEVELTEAVLRWGLNNEANNRSPQGRMNFLSAGQIPKPADGELRETGWSQSAGLVSIEKWNGKTYQPATWAGLSTDAGGKPISGFMSGSYTGHQTVFRGGQGTVDRDAGTAHIEWQGSASIVFYGGMVFFHLADPVLDVTASGATLTGTVSGYGSTIDAPDVSFPVAPRQVTLADFGPITLGELGFTATPKYDGVRVVADGSQRTNSFPQSFVTAMELFGTSPFWYDSGGSLDLAKHPLPVTVNFTGTGPAQAPPVEQPKQAITNKAKVAPLQNSTPLPQSGLVAPPAPMAPLPAATSTGTTSEATSQQAAIRLVAATPEKGGVSPVLGWWLGGAFFVVALSIFTTSLLIPVPASGPSSRGDSMKGKP